MQQVVEPESSRGRVELKVTIKEICDWLVFSDVSTEGLNDVILYLQPVDKKKNRGFCFLEYEDHKTAAQARRRLMSGKVKVWGNLVTVEWADPLEDPDPEVMAKVRIGPRATTVAVQVCICFPPTLNLLWPSPGQGVVREEPGKQRHGGVTGEGLQSVWQAGASEETQRLRLHPLWGKRWCSEGMERGEAGHFWWPVAGGLKCVCPPPHPPPGSGWSEWQRPGGRAHWDSFCQASWSEEERAQSSEASC